MQMAGSILILEAQRRLLCVLNEIVIHKVVHFLGSTPFLHQPAHIEVPVTH